MAKFKRGDVVRVKEGKRPPNYFSGTAIYRGDSTYDPRRFHALERKDGDAGGGAQNGWWNFRKEDEDDLELVGYVATTTNIAKMEPGSIVSTDIYRDVLTLNSSGTWCISELLTDDTLIKPKKTLMTKLTNMIKKFLDADAQALVEAGFINGDLELTEAGRRALTEITFDKYKADLVAVAKAQIEEAKKKD